MHFFLYDMEELFNGDRDGDDGNTVAAISDTKNVFVCFIYWNWAIAHTIKYSVFKNSFESIEWNLKKDAIFDHSFFVIDIDPTMVG